MHTTLLSITLNENAIIALVSTCVVIGLALASFIWKLIDEKHTQAMKKMDVLAEGQKVIEVDLKPLALRVERHDEAIENIKGELETQKSWLGQHDQSIQELHRRMHVSKTA